MLVVQDGIDNLNKAIALRPDYDDAMAYLNLLYRRKADLQCGDPPPSRLIPRAPTNWQEKAMATQKGPGRQNSPGQPASLWISRKSNRI